MAADGDAVFISLPRLHSDWAKNKNTHPRALFSALALLVSDLRFVLSSHESLDSIMMMH